MKKLALALFVASMIAAPGCKQISERNTQADTLAKKVLDLIAAGEGGKIYDEMGATELKAQVTGEAWLNVTAQIQALVKPSAHSRVGFNIKTNNGVTTGVYTYSVTWANGKGEFVLKTKVENDKWTVLGLQYKAKP